MASFLFLEGQTKKMGHIHIIILLAVGLTSAIGLTLNETYTSTPETNDLAEALPSNVTARRGRQIHQIIELPAPSKKTKRQIIKIPPSVSKVKLVQPPLNLRQNRAPQQFNRYPSIYRSGGSWGPLVKKSQQSHDIEMENSFPYELQQVKRNLKRPMVKEVSPEEFYRDEEYEFDHEEGTHRPRKVRKNGSPQKMVKIKRKKPNQTVLSEYLTKYEGNGPWNQEEGGAVDSSKTRYAGTGDNQFYGYDSAGSSIHMKQVPPPNSYHIDKALGQLYEDNYVPGLSVKKLPTKGRQIQSFFSQQYTTHNPHVTTNFGLSEPNGLHYGVKGSLVSSAPIGFPHLGMYSQMVGSANDQVVTALPVHTPGIQVIQPPQFRDVTVSHPSHASRLMSPLSQQQEETSSQKATIRDILVQDCPSFETKGYCDSPPRYPMQQIKSMIKKCASLMEVMNTQPFEEPHEVYGLVKRSDNTEERGNKSISMDTGPDEQSASWSRSSTDGTTVCISDLELTEPGYAKEVNSERWFVIVQHPDTTIQRIATDTCRNPGKSCGGLSDLKCSKINSLPSKSTRCVQRHTYQRLISWDPESPDECPRMRVFRFPSACVCHLGVI